MPRFGKPGERIGYTVYPHSNDAPPLVLVHGFTASSVSFAANIPALSEHFTVITVDLLGHGDSDAPEDAAPYAPGPAIERILGLMDRLGYDRILLCGHSLGAAVCLRLALEAPDRLAGLILINSMSAAGTPEWREQARAGMDEMAARLRNEGSAFLRQTRLYPAHSKRLDPASRELLTRAFDETDPNGLAGTAEALVVDVNSYERLGELAVPALLVVGARETAFAEIAPDFVARMPAGMVREVHLEEAGHAANLEQPRDFEAAVTAFARALDYPGPQSRPARGGGRGGNLLTAAGVVLVIGGLALLVGSLIFVRGGDGEGALPASAADAGVTIPATTQSLAAGARTTGAGTGDSAQTATPAPAAATAATATQPAAATIAATQAPASTSTPQPAATPTIAAAAPTSTAPVETPAATVPAGPSAAISGPASAPLNAGVTFVGGASGGGIMRMSWSAEGGTIAGPNQAAPTVTFSQAGCKTVSVTVFFESGATKTASTRVAVGPGATCQ